MTTFKVEKQTFSSRIDQRTGTPCVQSIHPYDETEYHWARKSPADGRWNVYLNGERKANYAASLTEEQVAARLLNRDREAHLTRTGGIW